MKPISLRVNRQALRGEARARAVEAAGGLVLSWGARGEAGARQGAYRLTLCARGQTLLDTGRVQTEEQYRFFKADALPRAERIDWTLWIEDENGLESEPAQEYFYIGDVDWTGKWITWSRARECQTQYFRRDFTLSRPVRRAALYACGLGYHRLLINGAPVDAARLDPAHTDYSRQCQYVLWPDVQNLLSPGGNCLAAMVGGGWRDNPGEYQKNAPDAAFFGVRQFRAMLDIEYADGARERLETDETWRAGGGGSARSHLFHGEDFDANLENPLWARFGFEGFEGAAAAPDGAGEMRLMCVPPVREMGVYRPVCLSRPAPGVCVIDFGQNLSGVVRVKLHGLSKGRKICVTHAEELDENGLLYTAPLRGAKAEDTYTASGDGRDLAVWQPEFTYHGFRYACVRGYDIDEDDIEAVLLHTDLENGGFFRCGSDAINALQAQVVATEKDNMHSILTDCPQRDERMGWMNDATVRFEETPYNFDCAPMFRKIVRDIQMIQRADGAIACTAPKVFGAYPADPVCSSFFIAAWQAYLHFGDLETVREGFSAFCAWEDFLLSKSEGFLVNYSYYGDWAGPEYACVGGPGESPVSRETPGVFMSTGYSHYNCKLLCEMARALEMPEAAAKYARLAGDIARAMREKWYSAQTATFATGSMGCQAFALWLGIVPEEDRARAAAHMHNDLLARGYAFTTGNLCTRYLLDMLAEYGYADDAYALLTRDTYPSWGFMRQHEATTVWERFELKKNPGMNSHNHPMYGAAGAFLYAHLAGIQPLRAGYARFRVKPHLPEALQSAQAAVNTPLGKISVRWVKRYGRAILFVDVPFAGVCEAEFLGETRVWTHGSHMISVPYPLNEQKTEENI